MFRLQLILATTLLLLAPTLLPEAAWSFCPCSGSISAHRSSTNSNRDANTEKIVTSIAGNLAASTGQITGYIDKSITAMEKLLDGQSLNDSLRTRQVIRAGAESGRYDPAASSCQGMRVALLVSDSDPGEGPVSGTMTTTQIHQYENCLGDETVCRGVQTIAQSAIDDQLDLRGVGGLTDPTTDIGLLLTHPTIGGGSRSEPEDLARALSRLRRNILNPFPARPPTEGQLDRIEGSVTLARHLSDTARRSVAGSVFELVENQSAPTLLPNEQHLANLLPEGIEVLPGERISERQLYGILVQSTYRNPEWHARLAAASPEALARELVLQTALANDLNWKRYELDLHRAILEATQLAHLLEERDPS
ncbi:MAG: hypothetical protein OXH65_02950 [Paracoccaceae bacterium]|nr:hypothetical protein [Paracoccaceae bacterium]